MTISKIILGSGKIKVCKYTPEDGKGEVRIRSVVDDLYKNIPDLECNIDYIISAKRNNDHTILDVINEYISKYNSDNTLIMCTAGTISDAMVVNVQNNSVIDGLKVITLERGWLYKAGFLNLVFDRVMSRSYGDPNIFIYKNNAADDFIAGKGDNVIKRYSSKDIATK